MRDARARLGHGKAAAPRVSFASISFLLCFLPLVLLAQALLPWRNATLLLASLIFYAWGDPAHLPVLLYSILLNWALGLWMERRPGCHRLLWLGILLNLLPLLWFKMEGALGPPPPQIPLGLSFFTFQAISYLVDIHRGLVRPERRLRVFALYKALFPLLIAGPILRYREIAGRLERRRASLLRWRLGMTLFILGLGQKVLLADTLAVPADRIFALPAAELGQATAWLGVLCFHLQLFFDFAGYSTMAIGLGHMLGLRFPANFDRPYLAQSLTEFWRRWHMTLSAWFRDYVYIPLGGNRGGAWRTGRNLLLVYLLCGLWHGAAATFVLWGLFHGALMLAERLGFGAVLDRAWRPLRHLYLQLALLLGWALFRGDSLEAAWTLWRAMAGLNPAALEPVPVGVFLTGPVVAALLLGGLLACLRLPRGPGWVPGRRPGGAWRDAAALLLLFLVALAAITGGTHQPFIYGRF